MVCGVPRYTVACSVTEVQRLLCSCNRQLQKRNACYFSARTSSMGMEVL